MYPREMNINMEQDRKFYDEAFMEVFTNKKIVKSLLEDFIKEQWVDLIDFSSMKATKSVFKGIDDSKKESDLLLKFELKKGKPNNLYIFILLEFQSKAEPMILRLFEYLSRIYKKQKSELNFLNPVIPIVIYNGGSVWKEKTEFIKHFPPLPNDIQKYIPKFRYILIDIARFSDESLLKLKDAVSFFFLLDKTDIKKKDIASTRIINILKELRDEDPEIFKLLGRYISGLLRYKGVEINTINDYIDERGESMLAQSLDELKEEGRVEGLVEGRVEGRVEEKITTAKKMLDEGLDIKMISHITGLSISELEKL